MAFTRPGMSYWRASTSTFRPKSRIVFDVMGPMEAVCNPDGQGSLILLHPAPVELAEDLAHLADAAGLELEIVQV